MQGLAAAVEEGTEAIHQRALQIMPPPLPPFSPPNPTFMIDSLDARTLYIFGPVIAMVALLLGVLIGRLTRAGRVNKLEQKNLDRQLDIITNCLCDSNDGAKGRLQHPMVVIRAQDFLTNGRIMRYEELRRSGQHIVLDTTEQLKQFERKARVVFFSQCVSRSRIHDSLSLCLAPRCLCVQGLHKFRRIATLHRSQWTSHRGPDPTNKQYRTMVAALQKLQTANSWPLERIFVWIEYVPSLERRLNRQFFMMIFPSHYSFAPASTLLQ